MTLPRVIACLILFPILMGGISYLLYSAADSYGYLGVGLDYSCVLTSMVLIGK